MESELVSRLKLYLNPIWTYKEIMQFDPTIKSPATAIKIKDRAIKEKKGASPYGTKYATTESVLALYGTTREKEINLIKGLLNEKELQEINFQN